ncbi:MAG: hypothetical protein A2138_08640 [Deltaproteobacteria bacterium RBG_16_71_12]|nr:MAG: hypothetical protein A2138_08640 [Deltaproteobacteria bacterium RBG_16_71_12]
MELLVVDLDGTLVRGDLLAESFFSVLKHNPFAALFAGAALFGGRAQLKRALAERAALDVASLPYDDEVLALIEEHRAAGTRIVLATATDERLADAVASHLGVFDDVWASNGTDNLKGDKKRAVIEERAAGKPWAYVGDADADVDIFRAAPAAIAVAPASRIARWKTKGLSFTRELVREGASPGALVGAMRPHQWAKNLLLFVPLFLAHRPDAAEWLRALLAFVSFCLVASAAYIGNDLMDLTADRRHPKKRRRAFAAGRLPLFAGLVMVPALLGAGAAVALLLPLPFLAALAVYAVSTVAYSWRLKQLLVVDVVVLAGLYTLRLVAGALAAEVEMSFWLSAFSLFIFTSLALAKRHTELGMWAAEKQEKVAGRGYLVDDRVQVGSLGAAAGFVAVLVLALYIHSDDVRRLYARPTVLWGVLPLLLYWINRVWVLAARGVLHDDPIVFALRDRASWIVALLAGALVLLAR